MICPSKEPIANMSDLRESFEELSYVYIFKHQMKTQVSERKDVREYESMLFHC